MNGILKDHPLLIVVGAGGVGKTTVAAALGTLTAAHGRDTLVMTFDPSRRLKDALGVGEAAREQPVRVGLETKAELWASLLDARVTFDRLVASYAPNEEARQRILQNRVYQNLTDTLGGVLEYMAVERLFEVSSADRYQQVILDTPPTRQALDFIEAPQRIVGFLDSGAIRLAMRGWFDEQGRLKPTSRLGFLGKGVERFLDRIVGLDLLRDVAEFFEAFGPLYSGFRERALEVQELLRSERTLFLMVTGPGKERIPETLFFARRLAESGCRVGPLIVNRVHPRLDLEEAGQGEGIELFRWLGERDHAGVEALRDLLPKSPMVTLPIQPVEIAGLDDVRLVGELLGQQLPLD